jgi:hypothetical protein
MFGWLRLVAARASRWKRHRLLEHQVRRAVDAAHAAAAQVCIEPVLPGEDLTDLIRFGRRVRFEHGAILRAEANGVRVLGATLRAGTHTSSRGAGGIETRVKG